jgi:hypothetical protein
MTARGSCSNGRVNDSRSALTKEPAVPSALNPNDRAIVVNAAQRFALPRNEKSNAKQQGRLVRR